MGGAVAEGAQDRCGASRLFLRLSKERRADTLCWHAQRQFSRLVEMLQLLHTDEADPRAWRAYRLQVKERLYRFNFVSSPVPPFPAKELHADERLGAQEMLMQLEKPERQEKLEETFQGVVADYRRILAMAKV